jgi:hypothetical protein
VVPASRGAGGEPLGVRAGPPHTSSRRSRRSGHLAAARTTAEQAVDIRLELRELLVPLGEQRRTLHSPRRRHCRSPRRSAIRVGSGACT